MVIFLTSALSKKVIPPLKLLQWWAFCIALKEVRHFVAFDWRWCAKVKLGHLNRNKVTTDRLVIKIYIYIYINIYSGSSRDLDLLTVQSSHSAVPIWLLCHVTYVKNVKSSYRLPRHCTHSLYTPFKIVKL